MMDQYSSLMLVEKIGALKVITGLEKHPYRASFFGHLLGIETVSNMVR